MKRFFLVAPALMIMLVGAALAADSVDTNTLVAPAGTELTAPSSPVDVVVAPAATGGGDSADKWRFALTPIAFWSFNIKGPVTLRGHTRFVNASPSDVRDNMTTGAGLAFSFGKGAWTFPFALQGIKWEVNHVNGPAGIDPTDYDLDLTYSQWQAGIAYALPIARGPKAPTVQLVGFVRSSRLKLRVQSSNGNSFDRDKQYTWTDPFVGVNVVQPIKGKFFFNMNADIGGFGISNSTSQLSWDFMTGCGYHWAWDRWGMTLSGGYKAMAWDIQGEQSDPQDFNADLRFQGPVIALTFTF